MWSNVLLVVLSLGVAIHGEDVCGEEAVTCLMSCPFGFMKDHRGCNVCECLPELCVDVVCPEGKYCRSSEMTDGSDPVAFCSDPRLPRYCQLPVDKGSCKSIEPRWYYDVETDTCTYFDYGGCQGNQNNFETENDCMNLCQPVTEGGCSPAMCLMACPNGFKLDERGCDVCACREEIPATCADVEQPMCPMHCPWGFKRGADGCPLCECEHSGEHVEHFDDYEAEDCLAVMCMIYCEHGYKVDSNGCNLCECREPTCSEATVQPMCMMHCEFGFRRDAEGCDMCECVTRDECQGSECRMSCPYGYLRDDKDCNLCVCHDPCEEKKCDDAMSCLVVDSKKGSYEAQCVPEHFKERPWCGDVIMCAMHCDYGFKSDARGCPVCTCQEEHPPPCQAMECDVPCPFGRQFDEDGCMTCKCMVDPCQGYSCEQNEVCEAFRKRCVRCPAEARCLEIVEVQRVRIDLVFTHPPVEDLDEQAFVEELIEEMSDLLDVDGEYIVGARVNRLDEESTAVQFHVLTTADNDDLVAAYQKLKEEIEENKDEHAITVEGQAYVPEPSKTAASYSSQRDLPDDDYWDDDDEEIIDTQTIIIIAAVVAGGLLIIAIVVIVSVYRKSKSQGGTRNVAYSKTPQSEAVRVKDGNPNV